MKEKAYNIQNSDKNSHCRDFSFLYPCIEWVNYYKFAKLPEQEWFLRHN